MFCFLEITPILLFVCLTIDIQHERISTIIHLYIRLLVKNMVI